MVSVACRSINTSQVYIYAVKNRFHFTLEGRFG